MSITLEPGRLALRKPELGGFLMVEVDAVKEDRLGRYFIWDETCEDPVDEWLPVLRPGDVVPAGSLLMYALGEHNRMPANRESRPWEALTDYTFYPARHDGPVALLRYGPEEDA